MQPKTTKIKNDCCGTAPCNPVLLFYLEFGVVDLSEAHGKAASSRKILGSDNIYDKFVSASALFKLTMN